jgi:hypothetical protein
MGRYSPPAYVTDRSGELLAQALEQASSGFFGGIERGRERRHQRDIEKQQHDDAILGMELSHPGLHRPGAPVPTGQGNALASALPNSPLIDDEYGSDQGPVASPSRDMGLRPLTRRCAAHAVDASASAPMPMKPANSGRGALPPAAPMAPIPGHPGAFDPTTGAFRDGKGVPKVGSQPHPAPAPAAPRVRQLSNGWTMNDDESDAALMHGKELERAFADRDRSRKVQSLMKAYQIPQEKAEALVDNPGIADNALYPTAKHEVKSLAQQLIPQPGDSPAVRAQKRRICSLKSRRCRRRLRHRCPDQQASRRASRSRPPLSRVANSSCGTPPWRSTAKRR